MSEQERALENAAEQFIAWREDGVPEHPMLDYFAEIFGSALASLPDSAGMPPLNDEMRAVLRNQKCVYQDEDTLYAALVAAAPAPAVKGYHPGVSGEATSGERDL